MNNPVRVGIAGCGKIARVGHVPGIQSTDAGQIVALCDVDVKQAERLRNELVSDANIYESLDVMLASNIDALCICTPNNFHYPMTLAALKAGMHVLCEKPMAAGLPEASEMISAAQKADRILHINQSLRYNPMYVTLAELIQQGEIGEILHLRCIRGTSNTPNRAWSPGADWFVSSEAEGGLVFDIGVHMADLLQWYGGKVRDIRAYVDTRLPDIDVPDNVNALMRFHNGAVGVLELSWTLPTGANLLEVYGTNGRIRCGFTEQPIELTRIPNDNEEPPVSYPAPKEGVKDSYQAFIDAVLGRTESPTPGELGRDAVALCDAIQRAGDSGTTAEVEY